MTLRLPRRAEDIDVTDWASIEPYFDELRARPLTPESVPDWLEDWSRLSSLVGEAASWVSIKHSQDTADQARKDAYMSLVREVGPHLRVVDNELKGRLIATGWTAPEMAVPLREFATDAALFRDENVSLLAEDQAKSAKYSEVVGGLTADFDGAERTLVQLVPYRSSPEREVRESAWRAGHDRMLDVREDLDELFDELLGIRVQTAANAGFDNYRDYRWQQMGRFDYTPEDAVAFQEAIQETFVPALKRQAARRKQALALDVLRPWDLEVDPHGNEPLHPFDTGDELSAGAVRIFDHVHPDFGAMVQTMRDEDLLDLDNRKGKAPGGYCASLPHRNRPFIFMNAVGTDDNVRTMLHEAGHAFHVFEHSVHPYVWQRGTPMEFAEVASMSMELLTSPYIAASEGGFYETREALRSRIMHLQRIVSFMPYMACVDAFQHWLYAHPDHSHAERDGAWLALHERYCIEADWSDLEDSRRSLWQHKMHIFRAPFYYIEYGLAQVGALQVWTNSFDDPDKALANYRSALALGNTRGLRDLFTAAGASLSFDAGTLAGLVDLLEGTVVELETELRALDA